MWTQIGKLGAIAVIRTALNYFLGKEMDQEAGRSVLRDASEAREQAEDLAAPRPDGSARSVRVAGPGADGRV